GIVGRLACVRGAGPTMRSTQRWNFSGSRGREILEAARWLIRTITVWSGGFTGPRKLKSHRNPTSCSRSRICGIPITAVQTVPTATPDAILVHKDLTLRTQIRAPRFLSRWRRLDRVSGFFPGGETAGKVVHPLETPHHGLGAGIGRVGAGLAVTRQDEFLVLADDARQALP